MSTLPTLEWSADFSVGLPEIDAQHAEIFMRIVKLKRACEDGSSTDQLAGLLTYLQRYVLEHFDDEEAYQESIGFPGFLEHKRMHAEFGREIERFASRLTAAGATEALGAEINRYMLNWLAVHVVVEDQKYVDHAGGKN